MMEILPEHKNCVICGCGGIVGDEIEFISNNPVCVHCITQHKEGKEVIFCYEASDMFKDENNGLDFWDVPNWTHNQHDVLRRFMRKKGYIYNMWNGTFER